MCTLDDCENNLIESVFARNQLGNLHHVSAEALLGYARHQLNLPPAETNETMVLERAKK